MSKNEQFPPEVDLDMCGGWVADSSRRRVFRLEHFEQSLLCGKALDGGGGVFAEVHEAA